MTRRISTALAGVVLLLGTSVLVAWLAGWERWLRLDPQLPSMKFNTALEFVLGALALLAALRERTPLVRALAAALLVLATLTLAQYLLGLQFGIDELFVRDYLSQGHAPGGRQAPISSLYFVLFGSACLCIGRDRGGRWQAAAASLAALALALGGASALGYLLDARPLLGWEGGLAVSPQTAFAQLVLAIALQAGLRAQAAHPRQTALSGIAEYALAIALLLGLLVWRGLVTQEQSRQFAEQAAEARWLAQRIEAQFRSPLRPLERMAVRWRAAGGTAESVWRPDAAALVRDVPGLISLQWLDRDGVVRWIEPEAPSRALLGTRPNRDPTRQALLAEARRNGHAVMSEPIDLLQGGRGLLLFAPLDVGGRSDGFLVAVLDLPRRLQAILGESTPAWRRRIDFDGGVVYGDPGFGGGDPPGWQLTRTPLLADDPRWSLLTLPGVDGSARSHMPEVVLASVALLAALLQSALLLGAGKARRARELQQANAELARHRQAQEALLDRLRRFNERFRLAADSAHIGVWDWDAASRTLVWDEWMYRLFDIDPAAGNPHALWFDRVHPDDRARLQEAAAQALAGHGARELELRVVRRDGSVVDLLTHSLPLDIVDGRARRMLGVVLDISERKRLERLQNEFVATVSHELRTPLTAINGALALVAGGAVGPLPDAAAQLLAVARGNSQRLTALINDLLDMEKLLAGGVRIEFAVHPLAALVEQAVAANRGYAEPLRVRYVIEPGPDCRVRVDAARLQQVLANLLSNAAKFSPPDSEVRLRWHCHDGVVRIEVVDRGRGIAAEFHERIFRKFSQADGSDTRRQGGTGLGLAISRELVERMEGRIGFESRLGEGSTFWIELPLPPAPA